MEMKPLQEIWRNVETANQAGAPEWALPEDLPDPQAPPSLSNGPQDGNQNSASVRAAWKAIAQAAWIEAYQAMQAKQWDVMRAHAKRAEEASEHAGADSALLSSIFGGSAPAPDDAAVQSAQRLLAQLPSAAAALAAKHVRAEMARHAACVAEKRAQERQARLQREQQQRQERLTTLDQAAQAIRQATLEAVRQAYPIGTEVEFLARDLKLSRTEKMLGAEVDGPHKLLLQPVGPHAGERDLVAGRVIGYIGKGATHPIVQVEIAPNLTAAARQKAKAKMAREMEEILARERQQKLTALSALMEQVERDLLAATGGIVIERASPACILEAEPQAIALHVLAECGDEHIVRRNHLMCGKNVVGRVFLDSIEIRKEPASSDVPRQ